MSVALSQTHGLTYLWVGRQIRSLPSSMDWVCVALDLGKVALGLAEHRLQLIAALAGWATQRRDTRYPTAPNPVDHLIELVEVLKPICVRNQAPNPCWNFLLAPHTFLHQ